MKPIISVKRSPLFYVGDKYKLMSQLVDFFPDKINNFYEPFVGGGTVFLNIKAKKYFLNDIDFHLVNIHKFLTASSTDIEKFFNDLERIIYKYKLSHSYKKDVVPGSLKKKFKKTYYARFNKEGYEKLRTHVNRKIENNSLILYVLLIYGFNRMLRFNSSGKFNLPVGNVDLNRNVVIALHDYFSFVRNEKIKFTSKDFRKFFSKISFKKNDFAYFDPPYLIASSEYNKIWNVKQEKELLTLLDELNRRRVKFALSNVTHYCGRTNDMLIEWMKKYKIHKIKSNYINYHNNVEKKITEVLITNY